MTGETRAPFAALGGKTPEEVFGGLVTPCYILDEGQLKRNGEILAGVAARTGCRWLLAQKAFSNYDCYPVLAPYLAGTEASGLFEARLGFEELPDKEVHVFCGAYRADEFDELLRYAGHIVFNSPAQLAKFGPKAKAAGKSLGLRINPECSTQEGHAIYDPCAPGSRFGVLAEDLPAPADLPSDIQGFHIHCHCESSAEAFARTLVHIINKFSPWFPRLRWINFGGGHLMTRQDYNVELLVQTLRDFHSRWPHLQMILEPGSAFAWQTGPLVASVVDIVENHGIRTAILDVSFTCHMPDCLEMPYHPSVKVKYARPWSLSNCGGGKPLSRSTFGRFDTSKNSPRRGEDSVSAEQQGATFDSEPLPAELITSGNAALPPTGGDGEGPGESSGEGSGEGPLYRLGGNSCLSGDFMGTWRFPRPLSVGDEIIFEDMIHYTTVKTTTFNGVHHPSIVLQHLDGTREILREYTYEDYKNRMD